MNDNEKRLLNLEFKIEQVLSFVEKVANDSESFTLMKKDIEECKQSREHLPETIDKQVDVYMNKPENRTDLAKVIDDRVTIKLDKVTNSIALKVLFGVTGIATTVLTGVIMLWIK